MPTILADYRMLLEHLAHAPILAAARQAAPDLPPEASDGPVNCAPAMPVSIVTSPAESDPTMLTPAPQSAASVGVTANGVLGQSIKTAPLRSKAAHDSSRSQSALSQGPAPCIGDVFGTAGTQIPL